MVPAPLQLTLPLGHEPQYGREDFVAGSSNEAALRLVENWPDWPAPVVVLSGPPGSGKTHLVHIWARRAAAGILAARRLHTETLVPPGGALAVEDVDTDKVPELTLFHLINSAREVGASLLITSRTPAADWRVSLPDLFSRLRMAAPLALQSPDEHLLRKVLVKLFADRQLFVDKVVIEYLLLRMERSFAAALLLVDSLDREALAAGSRITRPLAAKILFDSVGTLEFSDPD